MSARCSSRRAPANDIAPGGAPIRDSSTSTADAPGASRDGNESEQADNLAIGFRVPATGSSEEHVLGNLSDHANPSLRIPQPCFKPACADSAVPSACPVLWQILHSSPPSQKEWPKSSTAEPCLLSTR